MRITPVSVLPVLLGVLPALASAQFDLKQAGDIGLKGGLVDLIAGLIRLFLGLVAVLALAFIVYGGFLYITSQGDEAQAERAKKVLTYAVIGIIVIGLAYAVVSFVITFFIRGGSGGGQVVR
jgi:cytochrome bd-type quinol oxidase subunit 2